MSILDYATGLFREPANLRAFVDDPQQALRDAGFPDATPEQVHDLMSLVADTHDPLTPQIEVAPDEPADDYPDPGDDQAAQQLVDPDFSAVGWGKAIE